MKRVGFRERAACRDGESWRRRSVRCQWRTTGPGLDGDEECWMVGLLGDSNFDFGGIVAENALRSKRVLKAR